MSGFILGAEGTLLRKVVGSLGEPEAQSLGFSEEWGKIGLRKCILGFVYLVGTQGKYTMLGLEGYTNR